MLTAVLLGPTLPLEARTKKGDKFLAEGRMHEQKKEWDAALQYYEQALSEDPADILYQMAATKVRFQAAQSHIDKGLKLRSEGQLGEALVELQKAYAINPGLGGGNPGTPPHHGHDRAGTQTRTGDGQARLPQRARDDRRRPGKEGRPKIASPAFCRFPNCGRWTPARSICG